ncbi:MAG: hypothetical protein ACW97X_13435, partial [Candidatus Hodarchaeales archaeon]
MPIGPFRKKKKVKDLPKPPSFSEEEEEISPLQQELNLAGKTTGSKFREPPKQPELKGPPRTTEFRGPPKQPELKGPPRIAETREPPIRPPPSGFEGHPNLPPPPVFSTSQRPSTPTQSNQPVEKVSSLFGNEAITDDILGELKQKKFGSALEKTPSKQTQHKSVNELARRHFEETTKNYIEAGQKHEEMGFYDNAAVNFACAVLSDFIANGVEAARRTMAQLSSGSPSSIRDNIFFESSRLIVEATRTKSYPFLTKAEKTFQNNIGKLYPEDAAIVETAL